MADKEQCVFNMDGQIRTARASYSAEKNCKMKCVFSIFEFHHVYGARLLGQYVRTLVEQVQSVGPMSVTMVTVNLELFLSVSEVSSLVISCDNFSMKC